MEKLVCTIRKKSIFTTLKEHFAGAYVPVFAGVLCAFFLLGSIVLWMCGVFFNFFNTITLSTKKILP